MYLLGRIRINLPQSIAIAILQSDVKHLKTENEALKAENKRLESRNEEILEDSYKIKFEIDKKHSNNSLGTTIIRTLIHNLPDIIDCLKPISQNRLNAPDNLNYGSEVKNRFSKYILTIDDKALLFIMSVLNSLKTNQNFECEMYQLTKKYNVYG